MDTQKFGIRVVGLCLALGLTGPAVSIAGEFVPLSAEIIESEESELNGLLQFAEVKGDTLGGESMFRILNLARSYQAHSLFDDAERWYGCLAEVDGEGIFEEVGFNGQLAIELGRGDWEKVEAMIFSEDVPPIETEARHLFSLAAAMGKADRWHEVLDLVERISASSPDGPPAPLLMLKGWSLLRLGRIEAASCHYESILTDSRIEESVHPTVMEKHGVFIKGAGDCAFLLNDRLHARRHFRLLLDSEDAELRAWGYYRIAQLDMLENGYEDAAAGFARVAADSVGPVLKGWAKQMQAHAEAMSQYTGYLPDERPSTVTAAP